MKVLVTSCGGDIGQSIGKILNELNFYTYGLDISKKNPSSFIFKKFDTICRIDSVNYVPSLIEFVRVNDIDLIIPASESEIKYFTYNEKNLPNNILDKLLLANKKSRIIGFDKLKTVEFLMDQGLPYPKVYSFKLNFPCIGKTTSGSGGSNVFRVENEFEANYLRSKYDNIFFQELLSDDSKEYTCCCYRGLKNSLRMITFKRDLAQGGYSSYGVTENNIEINKLLKSICKFLDLRGSINIQLRIHKDLPVVFEINPRFSSTVGVRHLLGFEDLKWSIQDFFNQNISNYKEPPEGSEFFKGYNDYVKVN